MSVSSHQIAHSGMLTVQSQICRRGLKFRVCPGRMTAFELLQSEKSEPLILWVKTKRSFHPRWQFMAKGTAPNSQITKQSDYTILVDLDMDASGSGDRFWILPTSILETFLQVEFQHWLKNQKRSRGPANEKRSLDHEFNSEKLKPFFSNWSQIQPQAPEKA